MLNAALFLVNFFRLDVASSAGNLDSGFAGANLEIRQRLSQRRLDASQVTHLRAFRNVRTQLFEKDVVGKIIASIKRGGGIESVHVARSAIFF